MSGDVRRYAEQATRGVIEVDLPGIVIPGFAEFALWWAATGLPRRVRIVVGCHWAGVPLIAIDCH